MKCRYILDAGRRSSIIEEPNTKKTHASAYCKSIFLNDEFCHIRLCTWKIVKVLINSYFLRILNTKYMSVFVIYTKTFKIITRVLQYSKRCYSMCPNQSLTQLKCTQTSLSRLT
ncbi:hypothetical protein Hanom_Chr17g01568801 [Helianthus anomalus]